VSHTIRQATLGDAEAVFTLLTHFVTSYAPSRTAFDRHYPVLLKSGDAELLVAIVDDAVVGYALGFQLPTLHANGTILIIQELVVDPAHRRQGHGRALVEALLARGQASGAVEATVPTRRAGDFYRHLGFLETARYLKRPFADGE
jgi:ribosomal protein S18 acetylase RimI-like enzyme